MAEGKFEPLETDFILTLLPNIDIFINVGANIGYYVCHALSFDKEVIAIEPAAQNIHYLLTNLKQNGWEKKAEVFPVAVSGSPDVVELFGGNTGASLIKGWASTPLSYVTNVPALTLDRILADRIRGRKCLILVDIEGAEFAMLQGALLTLQNDPKPIWIVEICSAEHQPSGTRMNPNLKRTFEMFFDNGYAAFTADEKYESVDRKRVSEVFNLNEDFTTHNFVFTAV